MLNRLNIARGQIRRYAVFVNCDEAFDAVWRSERWHKLQIYKAKGKIINRTEKNLYKAIKSQIVANGQLNEHFPCSVEVRQGENLSALLSFQSYLEAEYDIYYLT